MIIEIIKILIDGLLVGLASSVTVGPVAVLCIQRTLSRGYLSGIFSGLGVASADTLMAILAFTLYALLKDYIDKYDTIILSCGGVFVIIVGIFIFFKTLCLKCVRTVMGQMLCGRTSPQCLVSRWQTSPSSSHISSPSSQCSTSSLRATTL